MSWRSNMTLGWKCEDAVDLEKSVVSIGDMVKVGITNESVVVSLWDETGARKVGEFGREDTGFVLNVVFNENFTVDALVLTSRGIIGRLPTWKLDVVK